MNSSKMRFIAQMTAMLVMGVYLFLHPDVSVAAGYLALTAQYTLTSKGFDALNARTAKLPEATP